MNCRRCGGNTVAWASARDRQGGPIGQIRRCITPGCGIGQTVAGLGAASAAPGWWPQAPASRALSRRVVVAGLRAAGVAVAPGGRAIDVGAGAGLRADALAAAGMRVLAIEPDPTEAARLCELLGDRAEVIAQPLVAGVLPRGAAELVVAWHVLEHLPDLDAGLAEMLGALIPGGRLVLAVPNAASLEARVFRGRWHGWEPARHRWHFTAPTLGRVLAAAGFSEVDVRVAGGWGLPTSLAYSMAPGLDHQGASTLARAGLGLVAACIPLAGMIRAVGQGSQLIAVATCPTVAERGVGRRGEARPEDPSRSV